VHVAEIMVYVPAAEGLTAEQFEVVCRGTTSTVPSTGLPPPSTELPVVEPSMQSSESWKICAGDRIVSQKGYSACAHYCNTVTHVSTVTSSKTCALVFFPVAVASYSFQGRAYRHIVNLLNCDVWGVAPMDTSALRQAAIKFGIDVSTVNAIKKGTAAEALWKKFLSDRWTGLLLLRYFLEPPPLLQQRMHEGYTPEELERLKRGIKNTLAGKKGTFIRQQTREDIEKRVVELVMNP
jgi:hypothetical protein